MKPAILTDLTKCIGCEGCVWACKEINGLPRDDGAKELSASSWTVVQRRGGLNVRRQCMHCLEPTCVSVCPVAALYQSEQGAVVYDESHCMGCRYCMIGCPFGVPKYEWGAVLPKIQKCSMCFEKRLQQGRQPACTEACPTGATKFGDRQELLAEARERIRGKPDLYVEHVYGETEVGGTSVLYLSSVPFEQLGFAVASDGTAYPKLTWNILSKLPQVVAVGGVLMFGIWWLSSRRVTLEKIKRGELPLEEAMKRNPPLVPWQGADELLNPSPGDGPR